MLQELASAFRIASRGLARRPAFTAAVLATLALGVGASSVVFTVLGTLLLRPLPYPAADRLAVLREVDETGHPGAASPGRFLDWKARSGGLFEDLAASFTASTTLLSGSGDPERVLLAAVTPEWLAVLGVEPALGRGFTPQDAAEGTRVLLSHEIWRQRFASDPAVLGSGVRLGEKTYTVVGVLPAGFAFPEEEVKLWVPLLLGPKGGLQQRDRFLQVIGRLETGTEIGQVRAALGAGAVSLQDHVIGDLRPTLRLVAAVVALGLLVSFLNLAILLLAHMAARRQEIAVRLSFGARLGHLARQLAVESSILALLGALGGGLIAFWTVRLVAVAGASSIPRANELAFDGASLGWAAGVSAAAWLLLCLLPVLLARRIVPQEWIREGGPARSRTSHRIERLLVAGEIALAIPLAAGALLLLQSMVLLHRVAPGFDLRNVLTVELSVPGSRYPPDAAAAFYRRLLDEIAGLPSVTSAGAVNSLPLRGTGPTVRLRPEGRPLPEDALQAGYRVVDPGYFATLRIPLLEGRSFSAADGPQDPLVLIVNRELAERFWPRESPLGRRLQLGSDPGGPSGTVVGVAGDVRHASLDAEPEPEVFLPLRQDAFWPMTLVIRTNGDPLRLSEAVRAQVRRLDEAIPVARLQTLKQVRDASLAHRRFLTQVLAGFAVFALGLGAIGVYGVTSYAVSARRREIGIRMALGADRGSLLWRIVGEAMAVAAAGTACGLLATPGLQRLLGSFLYGVRVLSLPTFLALGIFLCAVTFAACYAPARRASRMDPVEALRPE